MSTTNVVRPGAAILLTYRVLIRQLVTAGRAAALGVLCAAVVLVSWAVGRSNGDTPDAVALDDALALVAALGLGAVVPIVTLVFAGAALGDTREDGTLVYLWLRPMDRWPVVVGAVAASVTAALPFTVVPLVASSALLDVGTDLVTASLLSGAVAVVAYSAVFVLFGLLVRNSIVWGLAYVIVWEGVAAGFGSFANRLAIRGYTGSILNDRVGGDLALADLGQTAALLASLGIVVGAVILASERLRRMEVA